MGKKSATRTARTRTGPVGALDQNFAMAGAPTTAAPGAAASGRAASEPRRRGEYQSFGISRWLRFVLPLAALGLMAFVFTSDRPAIGGIDLPIASGELLALQTGMRVTNPRFSGSTSVGEPFLIRADYAEPDGPDPKRIDLSEIVGSITTQDGAKVGLTSRTGMLEPKENTVLLSDGVRIVTDDGYVFETSTLRGDADSRRIWSEAPVRGYGPAGEISAERLEIEIDGEGVAYFTGNVEVTIRQLVEPARK